MIRYPGDDRKIQAAQPTMSREEFVDAVGFDDPNFDMSEPDWVFEGHRRSILRHWKQSDLSETDASIANNKNLLGCFAVEFNVTDLCNRHCWMCPHHNEELFPNRKVFMEFNTVKNVIDDLKKHNFKGQIIFGGWGEPLLVPDLLKMIRYASDELPSSTSSLISNLDRLVLGSIPGYGPFNTQDLVDSGLVELEFDGYDNDARLAEYFKFLKPLIGVVSMMVHRRYHTKMKHSYLTRANLMDPLTGLSPVKNDRVYKSPCWVPLNKAFIDPEGIIRACCHNWDRKLGDHGNVNNTPFSELWMHSQSLNKLRKNIYSDRSNEEVCSKCDAAGATRSKSGTISKNLWKSLL